MRQLHDEKCNLCDWAFESRKKLKEHICKIHIRNPTHGNCYMKKWILANGCTPIYNKMTEKEIVTLHFDDCWRRICSCANLQTLNEIDSNDIFNAKVSRFVRNGLVNWSELMTELHSSPNWHHKLTQSHTLKYHILLYLCKIHAWFASE